MWPDSVVLEVFFIRVPFGDPEANDSLWHEVDEQQLSVELRRHLIDNGFRVGLVGTRVPHALQRLLKLEGRLPPTGETGRLDPESIVEKPPVMRRHLPVRKGQRKEIIASGIYEKLPLLICESGQISGQTYCKAQAIFAVKTVPENDGRVRVDLTPELHYDETRQRWVGDRGMLRLEAKRPSRAFDGMALSATLAPGNMLVIGCLPDRSGSLGYHFLVEEDGQLEQKLLVLRLSQTQHDELFGPPDASPVDE